MPAGHYTSDAYPIVYIKRAASTFLREAEIQGGGVTSNFKWQGWSHGQKSKPKKIPRASNKTPKNPMPNLRAIKISRGTMRPGYARTITNLQIVLNTQKIPIQKLPDSKTTCQTFSSQKIPKSKISNHPKNPSIIPITWNPEYCFVDCIFFTQWTKNI